MINIIELEQKVIDRKKIDFEEALELLNTEDTEQLFKSANKIRKHFVKNKAELCTIMNAKSGECSEDCKYCAQSVHYTTGIQEYPVVCREEALKLAVENEENGAHRFSLVTSGKGLYGEDFQRVVDIFKYLNENTGIKLCASHGILSYEQMQILKKAGVIRYHHNVETSRKHYSKICTTHTYEDRINTIKNAQRAGLEVCCGGIIGLGEDFEDRVNMALELRDLDIRSIPINVLTPIMGTPLENAKQLEPLDILKTIAMFRFVNPEADIRYAGGRNNLGDMQCKGLEAGINAALTGNYLTTTGSNTEKDIKMFKNLGFEVVRMY